MRADLPMESVAGWLAGWLAGAAAHARFHPIVYTTVPSIGVTQRYAQSPASLASLASKERGRIGGYRSTSAMEKTLGCSSDAGARVTPVPRPGLVANDAGTVHSEPATKSVHHIARVDGIRSCTENGSAQRWCCRGGGTGRKRCRTTGTAARWHLHGTRLLAENYCCLEGIENNPHS